jgi:hypothetical protein
MWRDPASILDMLQAARKALEYAQDLTEDQYLASSRDQDAIIHQLSIVGEAPNEFQRNSGLDIRRYHGERSPDFAMWSFMTTFTWTSGKCGEL